jgi:hypothetical protein
MNGYLGEFDTTEGDDKTREAWALTYIMSYGGIDGSHHKDWVLDQVARILHGTPVVCKEARWDNGHSEIRFTTGEPTQAYLDWVNECRGEYDPDEEEYEYGYDEGIAP